MFNSLKEKLAQFTKKIAEVADKKSEAEVAAVKPTLVEKTKALFKGEIILDEKDLTPVFDDLETSLLESDVALPVIEEIVKSIKMQLVGKKIKRNENLPTYVQGVLKNAIQQVLISAKPEEILNRIKKRDPARPFVIMFVGINGTGKTVTIAKFAKFLQDHGIKSVMAASDTFRAGAIEQLEKHGKNLGIRVIKHEPGADPAAVAFDAIEHAKARKLDVVLIDTAGRMQTDVNLMEEMKKIHRVTKSDLVIFVGDSLTGHDMIMQSKEFNDATEIDCVILTKMDSDARGGSALSISYVIKKPILFLGIGQKYEDLIAFDQKWVANRLLGEANVAG